ncbi:uncharacterized protein, partial [Drosophila kikkawai]|uniref:Retrovirus-related Pol polyprotein from transposon TNT 1-94 n=1 Tax=Drosophila kikkawai TaxID=30033 RepID=A0ABM4GQ91_DROKI
MHSVCKLAQRNCDPHQEHELAAKHILRYLSKTIDLKLRYQKTGQRLHAYVDADWANSIPDRKSYTGYGFFYGGSVISWESRKQTVVALSSTGAEYVALSSAAKEAMYLSRLLKEVGCHPASDPVHIYGDNLSAQQIATNPVHHKRTKHIDIRYHHVRE